MNESNVGQAIASAAVSHRRLCERMSLVKQATLCRGLSCDPRHCETAIITTGWFFATPLIRGRSSSPKSSLVPRTYDELTASIYSRVGRLRLKFTK